MNLPKISIKALFPYIILYLGGGIIWIIPDNHPFKDGITFLLGILLLPFIPLALIWPFILDEKKPNKNKIAKQSKDHH